MTRTKRSRAESWKGTGSLVCAKAVGASEPPGPVRCGPRLGGSLLQILPLPVTGCVTLGMVLCLSVPHVYSSYKAGLIAAPTPLGSREAVTSRSTSGARCVLAATRTIRPGQPSFCPLSQHHCQHSAFHPQTGTGTGCRMDGQAE